MKKILSMILTVAMMMSFLTFVSAANFPDVDANYSWAEEAIDALSKDRIITGYEDGTFKPGKSITRQEAITLLSKALGASDETNASIVNLAYGIYEAEIAGCEDSYAAKPGAYMIYRKVLTPDEVKDYLIADNRNVELRRYEAATLIAKALGADIWLKDNTGYTVEFEDKDEIPAVALGYVYYATELGIMNGMTETKFGPNDTVTRAQIAVMMKRILDTMNFEYVRGMISEVDTLRNNLSIKTDDGEIVKFGTGNSGAMYLDGNKVGLVDLSVGMECIFTFSNDALYQIDAITYEGEEVVTGAYRGKETTNAGTTIKLDDVSTAETDLTKYKLASNAVISYDGEAATLSDIKTGDYVVLRISGGLGVSLEAEPKERALSNLTVQDILTSSEGVQIVFLDRLGETITCALANEATFTRNSKQASFVDLAIGDSASVTLTYGKITNIAAIGREKSTEGTITEITISQNTSYITISKNGVNAKYPLARDCEFTLMDKSATIYDLRLGAYVKLTTSSEMVTKIESEALTESLSLTGTITTINSAYGMVIITYAGPGGEMVEKQLFIKDNAKILDVSTNKIVALKNLKVGNVITAAGTEKLGVYEVSSVMILQ